MTLVAIPACPRLTMRRAPIRPGGFDLARGVGPTIRFAWASSRLLALSLGLCVDACGRGDGIKGTWKMSDADKAGNIYDAGPFPSLRCPVALTFTDTTMAATFIGAPRTQDVTFRNQGSQTLVVLHTGNVLTFTRSGDTLSLEGPEKCKYERTA